MNAELATYLQEKTDTLTRWTKELDKSAQEGDKRMADAAAADIQRLLVEMADYIQMRASNEGRFALVLPEPGRYLMVTSADGWTPHSEVVGFPDATSTHQIRLTRRLTISGSLSRDGATVDAGLITLTKPTGEFASSTFSSAAGEFELPLPSTGRYILTAMDPAGEIVRTRQVAVIGASAHIDLDLCSTLTAPVTAVPPSAAPVSVG